MTSAAAGATGRCLCGSVSFEAEGVEAHLHGCHCGMCRRWTGGPALAAAVQSVIFSGAEHITRYASSDWAERGFCSRCGSHLFYRLKPADQYIIWMGAFDDTSGFELATEIYIDDKPGAYAFAGEHPRLSGAEFMASVGMGPTDDSGGMA